MADNLPFISPDRDRYLEDYVPGEHHVLGAFTMVESEMLDFSHQFDPQDIHIDKAKAEAGPFKGLIASGWHSCGLTMRIYARHYLSNASSLASPGMDELRWSAPVRAGDELTVHVTIENVRVSKSKPDRGILNSFIEVLNQDDALVVSMKVVNMIACRPTA